MKKVFIPLCSFVLLFSACKKSDPAPTPVTITKADFAANFKAGAPIVNSFTVNLSASPLTIPVAGENQSWDFSALAESSTFASFAYTSLTNASFPSATYAYSDSMYYGFGSLKTPIVAGTYFFEMSDNGWYDLGNTQNAPTVLSIPSLGATITYPIQVRAYTGITKYPFITFPAKYGDSSKASNMVVTNNFVANAPALGLSNTPGQTKETYTVSNSIMASGTVKLKGIGSAAVLVTKSVSTRQLNYFLGGAPAPAALLAQLGITDGAVTTATSYDFYAVGLGYVGSIKVNTANTAVTSAFFRKL